MSDNEMIARCAMAAAVAAVVIFGGNSYVGGERAKAEAARETKEAALALKHCAEMGRKGE